MALDYFGSQENVPEGGEFARVHKLPTQPEMKGGGWRLTLTPALIKHKITINKCE